jgi:hypothetical protein
MRRIGFTARRLLPLPPQVSQVGNAALVGREAAAIGRTVQHAFGFELADVGPAPIKVLRQSDALTSRAFWIAVARQGRQWTGG